MTKAIWDTVLSAAKAAHTEALQDFCAFPQDVIFTGVAPSHRPTASFFEAEDLRNCGSDLAKAFQKASPIAMWRETYKGTQIDPDFMDRFGCYCLIGSGGPYQSEQMGAYVVYMPAGLDYPWHHHPAEEVYLVLAGSAEFHRDGEDPEILSAGQTSYHRSNQPHATFTKDEPVIAYVAWKGDLKTKPIWTESALR